MIHRLHRRRRPRSLVIVIGLIGLIGLIALAATGCATTIVPGPGAHRVAGVGHAADARAAGVHVVAAAGAWSDFPSDLDDIVTSMLVTITNDSDRALEIRFEHFALLTPAGVIFAALPPFQVTGGAREPPAPAGPARGHGFSVAPYLAPWYPGWRVHGGPFPFDSGYYSGFDAFDPRCGRISLPTGDMLDRALPEGVLAPGGRISGYVYFEQALDVVRVAFVAHLVEVDGPEFGAIHIPFIVD